MKQNRADRPTHFSSGQRIWQSCPTSRYDALTEYLSRRSEPSLVLSSAELDRIVGGLPESAHRYLGLASGRQAGPASPGIHRFTLITDTGRSFYVGESDRLARRMGNYRNPGPTQPTNQRMNAKMVRVIGAGGSVDVAVILEAQLSGEPLGPPGCTSAKACRECRAGSAIALRRSCRESVGALVAGRLDAGCPALPKCWRPGVHRGPHWSLPGTPRTGNAPRERP